MANNKTTTDCAACRGNVAPDRTCYACGLKGPAGEGNLMCPRCLRFGPHECAKVAGADATGVCRGHQEGPGK